MPQPTIYPGSHDEVFEQLQGREGFGNADIVRDKFQAKLDAPTVPSLPLLSYPIDLGHSPENQFMIRFDISETGGAALSNTRTYQDVAAQFAIEGAQDTGVGSVIEQAAGVIASTGAVFVDAAMSAFGGQDGSNIQNTDIAGKGRDSFVEDSLGMKNLTTPAGTIYMYLPGSIAIGYGFEYEDADLSSMDILKGLRSLTETQTGVGAAAQAEIARTIGMSAVKAADAVGNLVGGTDILVNSIKGSSRQVQNPFVVHMFKGVTRRTFRFSFTMIPRSEKEANAIHNITTLFRKYAHPKRSSGGRFLDFPAEFNIAFLYQQKENIRMPRIRKCALKGINLNYGETTFTSTRPDSDGKVNPTKMTMELEFSELEILTQQSITEQGA